MDFIKWISITARHTKIYLDRHLAELGLNSSQHIYLVKICREPGLTQDKLFSFFYIHPSNITRSLLFLEKEGFVRREPNPKDKRTCCLYPTDKAYHAFKRIEEINQEWNEKFLRHFSQEEKEQFHSFLERAAMQAVEEIRLEPEEEKPNNKKKVEGD